jgi:PAS domain S-box-containing protein
MPERSEAGPEPRSRLHPEVPIQALTDAVPAGLFLTDLDGRCTYTNPRLQAICGFTFGEAQGQGWTAAIHPDDRDRVIADWTRATADRGAEWACEFRVRHKDGAVRWVFARSAPVTDGHGAVVGRAGTVEDVTARKAIEAEAAAAHARRQLLQSRFSSLVAASGALLRSPTVADVLPATMTVARDLIAADGYAVWRLHDDGEWRVEVSEGISREFAEASVTQQKASTFTTRLSAPIFIEDVSTFPDLGNRRAAFEREGVRSLLVVPLLITDIVTGTLAVYYRQRRPRDEVDMETAAGLGNLAAVALATAQISDDQRRDRERADQARQRAAFLADAGAALASSLDYEETLRTVARLAVPDVADWCMVDIVDAEGRPERVAAAHVDPKQLELALEYRARYPDDPARPMPLQQVLRTGCPVLVPEITTEQLASVARSDDQLARLRQISPRSLIVVPLTSGGRVRGALTFISAESGRRYDEDDLRFAQGVAARAALAVDNATAYAEVRAANRMRDEFLATLSHELRTPINAIMGWAQMLQQGIVQPERIGHAIEAIVRNAAAQSRLVEDLLDVSRIITGKLRLEVAAVDVAAVIAGAVATMEPAAQAKGVRLVVDVEDATSGLYGDRHRLQQAVWNLLSNAVKFTPRDGRVDVVVRRADGLIEIVVRDTGAGIGPDVLPFVFDRFRQADSSSTRLHTGMGLGLAIVRHIVELHGGTVDATSGGADLGAAFRIRLPVNFVLQPDAAAGGRAGPIFTADSLDAAARPDFSGVQVLIVEDDADASEMVAYVLRQHHAHVTIAESAAEALAEMDRAVPDVLLSDIELPLRDGHDLIATIRTRPASHGGRIPAAALTAHSSPEDRARSLLAGYDAHLSKPVDLGELIATVARLTARHYHRD